eukprot:NP_510106.2 Uncharacterized protein CELE_T24D5.5 [Caenorhabditis elegans]
MNNPKLGSKQLFLKTSNQLNRAILIDALPQNHTKNSSNRQNTYEPVASKKSEAFSALASSCVGKKTNPPCEIGPYVPVYGRVVVEIDDKIKLRRLMNHIPDHYSIPILRIVQFGEYNAGKKPRSLMSYRKRMTDCDYFSDALAIELLDFFEMIHNDVERANYVSRILDTKAEYYGFKSYDDRVSDIRFNKTRPAPLNTLHELEVLKILIFQKLIGKWKRYQRKHKMGSEETRHFKGSSSLSNMNAQSSLMVCWKRSTDDRVNAQRFATSHLEHNSCLESLPPHVLYPDPRGFDKAAAVCRKIHFSTFWRVLTRLSRIFIEN